MAKWPRYRDDAVPNEPAVTLDAFLEQPDASAVLIEAGEDVRALLPELDRIRLVVVDFPTYRDGRGYSSAQILREAGYEGEIRAMGDVLLDQLAFMRRCGFDSFAPAHAIDEAAAERALGRWRHVYQKATDDRPPVWKLRHG